MFLCLNDARGLATSATATAFAVAFTRHHEGIIGRFGRTGGVEGSMRKAVAQRMGRGPGVGQRIQVMRKRRRARPVLRHHSVCTILRKVWRGTAGALFSASRMRLPGGFGRCAKAWRRLHWPSASAVVSPTRRLATASTSVRPSSELGTRPLLCPKLCPDYRGRRTGCTGHKANGQDLPSEVDHRRLETGGLERF